MTTKKIDELPLSQLSTQELLGAYLPVSGIGGDADELQKINFANLKAMLLDNRAVEPHEYWRVYFDANNSTSFCGLTELQFFRANSITNAVSMFPGTPISSGGTPALAFDNGASSSGWNVAGSNQQWVGYHFSKAVGIARVRITAAQFTDQSPKDFRVQYSDNGTDWTDAWSVTGQTDWFNGEVRQFIDPDPVWIDGGEDGSALANKRIWAFYDAPNNVVRAGNGISINKTGAGNYQVTFDVPRQDTNYAILFGTADMGYGYGSNIMVYWNTKTVDGFTVSSYAVENRSRYDPLMSIEVIDSSNDTLGGFTDAPLDGKIYARKNGKWVQVGGSGAQERVKAAARIDCTNPLAPTIAAGLNVSGINRLGVGIYEITFTTAIDPALLAFNGGGQWNPASGNSDVVVVGVDRNGGMAATKITVNTKTLSVNPSSGSTFDCDNWFSFEVYDPAVASGGGGSSGGGIGDEAPTDGKGYVRRDAEWEAPAFSDLSDYAVTAPLNGQSLVYDAVTQKWKAGTPASKRLAKLIQSGHSGDVASVTLPANPKVGNLLVYVGAGQARIPATPANWTSLNATTDPNGRVNAAVMCRIVDQAQSSTNVVLVAPDGDYGAASVYEIDIDGRAPAAAIKRVDVFMEAASQAYQITDAALVLAVSIARPGGSTISMPADDWVYDGKGSGDNRNSWAWHQYAVAGQTVSPDFTNTSVSDYMSAVIYIDNADNSINEAPSDDGVYARRNRQWVPSIQDAPVDGRQYARKDGGWAQVVASGAASGGGNAKEGRVFSVGGVFEFTESTMTYSDLVGCTVTRVAQGRFKVTFDQPMANNKYGVLATGKWTDSTDGQGYDIPQIGVDRGYPAPAQSTTSFYLLARAANGTAYDARISFAVYEDAAALTQLLGGGINAAGVQGLANIRQAIKLAEVQYPVDTNTSDLTSPRFDYKIDWGGLVAMAYHGQIKSNAFVPALQATYQVPAGKKVYLVDGWGGNQNKQNGGFYGHRLFNVTQNVSVASPNLGQTVNDGWQLVDGALYSGNADSVGMPTAKVIGVAGDTLRCEIWNPSGDGHTRMNMGVYILAVVDENTNELADFTADALIGTTAKNAIFNYRPVKIEQISAGAKHSSSTASTVFPATPKVGNTILLLVAAYSGASVTVPAGFQRIVYSVPSANQGFWAFRKTSTGVGDTTLAVSINDGGSAIAYELSGEIANIEWNVQGGAGATFSYFVNDTKYGDVPLRFIIGEHDDTGAISVTNPKFTQDYNGSGVGNHWGIYGRVTADFHGPLVVNFTSGANNYVGELTITGPREIVPIIGETPAITGQAGKVLAVNADADGLEWVTGGSGGGGDASYPSFTSNAGKVLAVNNTEDGVLWVNGSVANGIGGSEAPWGLVATGTGASQAITLPESGLDTKSVLVFFNGVKQPSSSYTISGTTLTLTSNAAADMIEVQRAAAASPNMTATVVTASASFTVGLNDLGQYKRVSSATEVTITVPTNATVAFPIGSQMNFVQTGEGQLLFAAATGVTINYAETLKTRKKLSAVTLTKIATNEWDIIGDMEMSGAEGDKFSPPVASNWTLSGGNTTAPTVRDLPNSAGLMLEDALPGGSGRFGCYRGMAAPSGAHQIDIVYSVFRSSYDFYAFYGPGYMQAGASRVAGWAHSDTEAGSPGFGSATRWTAYDAIEGGLPVTNNLNSVTESLVMVRMRFVNDGTNITILRSIDDGAHWIEISTFPISTPFTGAPDVFGFFVFGTATGGTVNYIVHDLKVTLL